MQKSFWIGTILAGLGLASVWVLAQTQSQTVMGASGVLFGAKVTSWAKLNAQKVVQEVGLSIPLQAIQNAPEPSAGEAPPTQTDAMMAIMMQGPTLRLELPEAVKQSTFLDHVDLYWEKFGHPPDRYLTPHFDIHFFGVPSAAVDKIDCKNLTPPALELTPKGYAPAVPPGANAAEFCVPLMGFHGLPLSEFAAPGQLKPGLFDYTLISGFYNNQYIFTEPMITKAFLLKKQGFSEAVSRPVTVGRTTLYPTRFSLSFDPQANAYNLVYSGFVAGQ
ncbi:cytochrome c class I (plasmid) [Allomeiothermus silvanus DSM 9946]|uniref:Cytochrome c class I n=1 Tax=Allomeiothermus silvanus (strain ATCC 700542 / DSM 9946 / NBRC 106475 / NCIMB 13440 / VI-R2) TaxID=526227 RepID=D7BJC1_ALLS1|nr:DUF5602 domain-containing protein [Allomeiothermus silvanus]ADH65277.1 cytochrome c class I [Allomeiothermus silvanus DSM 9946]